MSYPVVELGIATALVVAGAFADVRRRRIPNAVNGALIAAGVLAQASAHGRGAMLSGLAAAALTLAVLWHPWLKGRIGGGDVKMAAAAATWVGLGHLLPFALATALAGGLVAVLCAALSTRQARQEMKANLMVAALGQTPELPMKGGPGRVSVPYGVAVALGAVSILWGTGTW
jgi:prepilin peptidase CpaA